MHPPIRSAFRQAFAQDRFGTELAFAKRGWVGQSDGHAGCSSYGPRLCLDCTPFPFVRSVAPGQRPDFFSVLGTTSGARGSAYGAAWRGTHEGLGFHGWVKALISRSTTTLRGIEPCVNISSSLHLRPPPFRAVWRRRPSAALPVPSQVQPSLMQRMKTWSPAPQSAVCWVLRPAACRGCRPAVATDLTAAFGRPDTAIQGPSGRLAPVAFVISAPRPGRGGRGERCSRRS
jgi:hypothetical protein